MTDKIPGQKDDSVSDMLSRILESLERIEKHICIDEFEKLRQRKLAQEKFDTYNDAMEKLLNSYVRDGQMDRQLLLEYSRLLRCNPEELEERVLRGVI